MAKEPITVPVSSCKGFLPIIGFVLIRRAGRSAVIRRRVRNRLSLMSIEIRRLLGPLLALLDQILICTWIHRRRRRLVVGFYYLQHWVNRTQR